MSTRRYSSDYKAIQPFVLEDIRRVLGGESSAQGATGIVGIAAHGLADTSIHTGQLAQGQATWAATKSALSAHAADPDAHHARQHVLATNSGLGADHTISGAVAGWVLRATSATAARMAQLLVTDLGASGASWDVASLVAANTVGLRTPASDVSAPLEALLKSNAAGELALAGLRIGAGAGAMVFSGNGNIASYPDIQFTGSALIASEGHLYVSLDSDNNATGTAFVIGHNAATSALTELFRFDDSGAFRITASAPTISTYANSLSMEPATDLRFAPGSNLVKLMADVALQSSNYVSQLTGMRVTYAGEGDFRYLYTDELHAKAVIADLEQALAGGQIISKSVTMMASDFTVPAAGAAATLHVKDLPSAQGMAVFQSGDIIRLRVFSRAGGGLTIADCWGAVTGYVDVLNGSQIWTFTRSSAPNAGSVTAGTVIKVDAIILDYGVSGNGYYEVNAIDGVNAVNSPYLRFVRWTGHPATGQQLRVQLGQLRGVFGVDEFGLFVGTGVTDADRYLHLSDVPDQNAINNLPIRMYNSGVNTGSWAANGQFDIGFDGLSVIADRDFTIHASRYIRLGRASTTNPNLFYDQSGGYVALRSGTTDKIRFNSDGSSFFAGVMTIGTSGEIRQGTGTLGSNYTGLRVWRDSNIGRIAGYNNNVLQWYAGTDGKLYAGAGSVVIDATGLKIAPGAYGWTDIASPVDVVWQSGATRYGSIGGGTMDAFGNAGGVQIRAYGLVSAAGVVRLSSYDSAGTLVGSAGFQSGTFTAPHLSANDIYLTTAVLYSDTAFRLLTSISDAQAVQVGSVLASNNYGHSTRVPTNGIYSLGSISTSGGISSYAADLYIARAGTSKLGLFTWGTYAYGSLTLDDILNITAVQASEPAAPANGAKIYLINRSGSVRLELKLADGTVRLLDNL